MVPSDRHPLLEKFIISVLNLSVYTKVGDESQDQIRQLEVIFENSISDSLFYNFQNESEVVNTFHPRNEHSFLVGESLFSHSLKTKLISQKDFFFNLGIEVNKNFPNVSINQFYNLLMIIRKYTLFMFNSEEIIKLPLFSSPLMEYLDYSSTDYNSKMKPFLNFMNGDVICETNQTN